MFSHTKLNFNIVSCSWGCLMNDCKAPSFQKSVDHKENCTFDDSGVLGWYTGGLASHQGILNRPSCQGRSDLQRMIKDEKKNFSSIWHKLNFKKKRRNEKCNAKNILSHAYNLKVALGYV